MAMADIYQNNYMSMAPTERRFEPYAFNGGNILAVAGEDFAIVASDTRLSQGFMIHSRDHPKAVQLSSSTVLAQSGFEGDITTLKKHVKIRIDMYEHNHGKKASTSAIASMISKMLYYKRFFPYYVYNIVAGLDDVGKGCVFSYDPVGSYEREQYRAAGAANELLQPLLDNQIGHKNMEGDFLPLSKEKALQLCIDCFISAAERDITTGDCVFLHVIDKDGIATKEFPLRRD
ncbi:proteasome subunit beta type-1-like [Clavelina lepadiformis]|uniref:Proteasome subunit beta n=1 Tax=Clavelina lepadiformis TaxID=159417 RepID=A0ABP0GTD9_CLALP